MKIEIYKKEEAAKAEGLCVVIDVLRAFTTAAFAFAGGAKEIILVKSVEEAFKKYREDSSLMLMGEVHGEPVEGFHFENSPAKIQEAKLFGSRLVQRTSAGTQGAFICRHAPQMLLSSFVVAGATLEYIKRSKVSEVSMIVTGIDDGDEDLALAEYLQFRLLGKDVPIKPFLDRVKNSKVANFYAHPVNGAFGDDLSLALKADFFPFAMKVTKENEDLVARSVMML